MQDRFSKGTFAGQDMISCRTLYKANGYSDEDFDRPVIGIVDSFSEVVPGHNNLRILSEQVKHGIYRAGGTAVEFGCIAVCDGVCTTHDGARYSLPSREIIADGIEIMARAHKFDGLVLMGTCDKTVPGMLMAAARLDIPCIFVAGGCMLGGTSFASKRHSDSTSAAEAFGMLQNGLITEEQLEDLSYTCCPTTGSCQHMATANTMCCMAEVMGLSLPGGAAIPAVYNDRLRSAFKSGETIVQMVYDGLTSRDILTRDAVENAVKVLMATGGSTNAVIHTCAIAHEIGMEAEETMALFEKHGKDIPLIARINPSSHDYDALDFYHAGGIPEVMKQMKDILAMDCMTVTGKTHRENIENYHSRYAEDREVITTLDKPFSTLSGLIIMHGNLAPETAVAKPAAIAAEVRHFKGSAICFDSEEECTAAIKEHKIKPGHIVVIRYVGPKGGPGMPEMFQPLKLLYGQGLNKTTALITDGRFSGTNNGCFVGHISPEAACGGPIAYIHDGDEIEIDVMNGTIELLVSESEMAERKQTTEIRTASVDGYLKRYAREARSSNQGGIIV